MSEYRNGIVLPEASPAYRVKRAESFDPAWLNQYDYAIINPLQVAEDDWSAFPCVPLTTPSTKVRDHVLPHLLDLNSVASGTLDQIKDNIRIYQQRGRFFFSALLKCDEPLVNVVNHFRFTLEQPRYGSSRKWWLRFYDPLVFRHMCWLLDSHQMDRLMGPIKNWTWPVGLGPWDYLDRKEQPDKSIQLPLLKKNQWNVIDRLAVLNLTIERLSLFAPETVKSIMDYPLIDRYIYETQVKHDLKEQEDQSLYAEQATRFGFKIHDHPFIKKRIHEVNKQGIGYAELCNDLGDEDLERMAEEMELETSDDRLI